MQVDEFGKCWEAAATVKTLTGVPHVGSCRRDRVRAPRPGQPNPRSQPRAPIVSQLPMLPISLPRRHLSSCNERHEGDDRHLPMRTTRPAPPTQHPAVDSLRTQAGRLHPPLRIRLDKPPDLYRRKFRHRQHFISSLSDENRLIDNPSRMKRREMRPVGTFRGGPTRSAPSPPPPPVGSGSVPIRTDLPGIRHAAASRSVSNISFATTRRSCRRRTPSCFPTMTVSSRRIAICCSLCGSVRIFAMWSAWSWYGCESRRRWRL